jgi:glycosyltransferase involved in cell wall biosynthesis
MLSIIIPAHKEPYLQKTIDSIIKSAQGEIEILSVLDGWVPEKPIKPDKRVRIITLEKQLGMRGATNAGIAQSRGEFIMKCDAHCAFGAGFDLILIENCRKDWLVIPRRYSLDIARWTRIKRKPYRDYHYTTYPLPNGIYGINMSNVDWIEKNEERKDAKYDIDDTMTFQGSCWMAQKEHFLKLVGFLDDRKGAYGPFGMEALEIGMKYWLSGGKIKIIKKAWYAHLSKSRKQYQKGIFTTTLKRNLAKYHNWSSKHWMENKEPGMIHPLSWLIEKFWPVPTWSEDRSKWVYPY